MRPAVSPVLAARSLLAAVMVALLVSPTATVVLEFTLYAVMLGSAECRARLVRAFREPLGAMALAFWLFAAFGVLYSVAPWSESVSILLSWRRLLLLVFALALFDEPAWKRRLVWLLIGVATVGAIASYLAAFLDVQVRYYPLGVVFRNHAIQSMVFALGAFTAALLLRDGGLRPAQRIFLSVAAVILVSNVVFVTTARSGYAVLLVLAVLLAYTWPRQGTRLKRAALTGGAALVVAGALASSPIVQQRVGKGLDEIANYQRATEETAIGDRVIYLRNGLGLAIERPLIGYGTGAFHTAYAKKVRGRSGREANPTEDPHNAYLNITVQHGVVGLIVFLALLASALRHPASEPYRLLGLAALAAWCVTSLFNGHFSTFAEGRFIWLWLGACLARENGPA